MTDNNQSIRLVPALWKAPEPVRAFTTTRQGGFSREPFASFNLGLHVRDNHADVSANRWLLARQLNLPAEPCWLHQTHGTVTAVINASHSGHQADASFTSSPNVVLAVLTADCLPVVITNTCGTELAVIHAGWRGLAGGIISEALRQFSSTESLHAWMGPAIGPTAFEVGEDVRVAFTRKNAGYQRFFREAGADRKYWCDLYAIAAEELRCSANVEVTGGTHCTVRESSLFYSHRRDGVLSGRMATLAWISTDND